MKIKYHIEPNEFGWFFIRREVSDPSDKSKNSFSDYYIGPSADGSAIFSPTKKYAAIFRDKETAQVELRKEIGQETMTSSERADFALVAFTALLYLLAFLLFLVNILISIESSLAGEGASVRFALLALSLIALMLALSSKKLSKILAQ